LRIFRAVEITSDDPMTLVRPPKDEDFDEISVIVWKLAGIVIPWPKGLSPKEAVLAWAKEQE